MPFDEIAAEVGIDTENNSLDETLDVDQGTDEGTEESGLDNSQETEQQTAFDPSALTPELQAAYKQMQSAFTPKLQEAARLREQYGELEPAVIQTVRVFQDLLKTDPFAARDFLQQQQGMLEQHLGVTAPPPNPFQNVEPLTPTEQALLTAGQQMWERLQQQENITQQHRFRAQQEQVERQFGQLETKYKTTIPLEDRHEVWEFMRNTGTRDVGTAWKALNYDKAMAKGAQKAAGVVAKKQQQPPAPTSRNQRSAPVTQSKGKGIDAHFNEAWSKYGGQ